MPGHTPYRKASSYLTTLNMWVSDRLKATLGTYTLMGSYTSTTNTPVAGYRWLREATVLAHNGTYVYPNPSGGSTGIVGVLEDRVMYPEELGADYNPICTVLLMGPAILNKNVITDGGTFGSVQAATETALAGKNIHFIAGTRI
jgi:hypothetical protein